MSHWRPLSAIGVFVRAAPAGDSSCRRHIGPTNGRGPRRIRRTSFCSGSSIAGIDTGTLAATVLSRVTRMAEEEPAPELLRQP